MSTNKNAPLHLFSTPQEQWPTTIVDAVIALYTSFFPDRLRAVYLSGSRTEDSAASVSDIDGYIIFKKSFKSEEEKQRALDMLSQCRRISPLRLDFVVWAEDENSLQTGCDIRLKLGTQLVYGEDIREAIPLPALADYQEHIHRWTRGFLLNLHDLKELPPALSCPDSDDEFFGYVRKRAEQWYPAAATQGTKELVATICWVATALIADSGGALVSTRAECIALAPQHLPELWARYVVQVYEHCKKKWDYKVPATTEEQKKLRELCQLAPIFFNYYLDLANEEG